MSWNSCHGHKLDLQKISKPFNLFFLVESLFRISIYEANQMDKTQCLVSFKVPKAVTSMKYLNNRMFLAQKDGTVLIYVRTEGEYEAAHLKI